MELTLRPKPGVKPIDDETAQRIARVAGAERVEVRDGAAVFGSVDRGNLELAARFELGAHWHTRYELVER
jgi:hypothetical protein